MFAIPIARKAWAMKKTRDAKKANALQDLYSQEQNTSTSTSPRRTWPLLLLATTPVLVTAIALILSILCVIGENMVQKLDNKIRSFQLDDIGLKKRADLVVLPATPTMAPTTLITMAPIVQRNIISNINSFGSEATQEIASKASSLKSKGKGEISEATSYLQSKANSIGSAVAAEASSIVEKIENEIIKLIHDAYNGLIDDMHIKDVYNVHIMASCSGVYQFQNGTNVTVGISGPPPASGPDSVHSVIDSCEKHSAIDPMSLIRIVYWIGIVHIIVALVLGIASTFHRSRKIAFANIVCTLFAFIAMGLASVVANGLALAATKVINFLGEDLGLAAYLGHKFLRLTWAATGLMAANLVLIFVVYYVDKRQNPTCTCGRPKETTQTRKQTEDVPMQQYPRQAHAPERRY
ncbi:hypothetical protein LTR09_012322 [Extremus antarcticus]|uniref:Uncharacterized protein n=1 Tax=Extremus antarcticus TaxID=702011 RepID=A0AAJ0DA83_9PEZI|nr:hypothetical protein LTR09_012322 [Extremus antarcticus]